MSESEHILFFLGRVILGGFFLWKAIEKMRYWDEAQQVLKRKKVSFASYVLPIATAVQIVGGLSVVLGFLAHLGAILLSLHMIAHMYRLHSFWEHSKGAERAMEKLHFMKDLAILGGLLILIAIGGGPISVYA